jgi:hypothetical protein
MAGGRAVDVEAQGAGARVDCPAHWEVGFLPEPMTRGAGQRGAAGGELRVRDDLRVGV